MAMLTPISAFGSGTLVNMGTTNSATIRKNVIIVSTSGNAIVGTGSNHDVIVNGTVASQGISIFAGSGGGNTGNSVTVGEAGEVYAFGNAGVAIGCMGTDATVVNHGYVESSSYGVAFVGSSLSVQSTITNTGTIIAGALAVFRDAGGTTQTIELKNSGLIESAASAYGFTNAGSIGKDLITNTGTMIGAVRLDGGADSYNGQKGTLQGDVYAGDGADVLRGGKEGNRFYGEAGSDKLMGNGGADTLVGGGDADEFIYLLTKDSTSKTTDIIVDFSQMQGDKINLKAIDASSRADGDQKFDFIGDDAFSRKAGELRFEFDLDHTYIYGDTNGDKKADFVIKLDTTVTLTAGDFIL
jgi:Ca2+-binding RTX toxin-like protein